MIFPPLIFILLLGFFVLAVVLFPLSCCSESWGPRLWSWASPLGRFSGCILLTLLGSLVNIPLTTLEGGEVVEGEVISYFGMRVWVPGPLRPYHRAGCQRGAGR